VGLNYTTAECAAWVERTAAAGGAAGLAASTVGAEYVRQRRSFDETVETYSSPPSDALLPSLEVLYPPNIIPVVRTLVIDLEDTIVHAEYKRERGWLTYKRPGVQQFLEAAWNLGWEVVLYTDQDHMAAEPVMEKIDPGRRFVPFRLFRDSTLYTGGVLSPGTHVRDLSRLNRDPRKTLYMTWDEATGARQPENVVRVSKWTGDPGDTQLLDMIPVLQMIVETRMADVRDVARAYKGQDLPPAFRERVKRQAQGAPGGAGKRGFLGGGR